jgi:hypothetical protein
VKIHISVIDLLKHSPRFIIPGTKTCHARYNTLYNSPCHISPLIRYSRPYGSYLDVLNRGLLLTYKVLNQGFLVVKLKLSLKQFYGRYHDLVNRYGVSVAQMSTDMFPDKQRSTKHCTDKPRSINTKPAKNLGSSELVVSSCSTCATRCFTLVTNPFIRHEQGKNRIVITTKETYPCSFVQQILRNG